MDSVSVEAHYRHRCDDHQHMSRPPVVTSGGTVHLRCDMEDAKWSDHQDEDHPVKWSSKGGEVRWCTLNEAVRRLYQYGHDKDRARQLLLAGHQLDTMFAVYEIKS